MDIAELLIRTIKLLSNILSFAIMARVLMSWLHPGRERSTRLGEVLYDITEPVISVARLLPHKIGMMDLAPIIALFGLDIVSFVLIRLIMYIFSFT